MSTSRRVKRRGPQGLPEERSHPNTFLGLPAEATALDGARFVVLPVPFERSSSYKKGTREGPQALIQASHHVEAFDEEVWGEPWKAGIHTAAPLLEGGDTGTLLKRLSDSIEGHLSADRFVVTLGGERTIAEGPVAACARRFKELSVLQIDAHANLRAMFEGSRTHRACTAHRLRRYAPLVQVGIRSVSEVEVPHLNKDTVRTFLMHQTRPFDAHVSEILKALSDTVYVTLDLDGLDPSVMPGVGTPVPGGLSFNEVAGLLKRVAETKHVVGADVCELSPLPDSAVSEFTAARLVYKIIAYAWARENQCKK